MKFEDLTPEQQEKARVCTAPEELLALANEEGYELSDEELKSITGGIAWFGKKPLVGDARNDIDEARVPEEFIRGEMRGDDLD